MKHEVIVYINEDFFLIENSLLTPIKNTVNKNVIAVILQEVSVNRLETLAKKYKVNFLQVYYLSIESLYIKRTHSIWGRLYKLVNAFYSLGFTEKDFTDKLGATDRDSYYEFPKLYNAIFTFNKYPGTPIGNEINIFKYKNIFFMHDFEFYSNSLKDAQDYIKMLNI